MTSTADISAVSAPSSPHDISLTELSTQVAHRLVAWAELELAESDTSSIEPTTLAGGYPGIALALLDRGLATGDARFLDCAHKLIAKVARISQRYPYDRPSLFSGTGGFLAVLSFFAVADHRYRTVLEHVSAAYAKQIRTFPLQWPGSNEFSFSSYDHIEGAAGQLGAICSVIEHHPELRDSLAEPARMLVRYLVTVSSFDSDNRLGWLVLPHRYWDPEYVDWAPHGTYNLGFSHGAPGILSALTRAHALDIHETDIRDTLRHLRRWIISSARNEEGAGPAWATQIPADERQVPTSPASAKLDEARAAWCYGAPGILIALAQVDFALGDSASANVHRAAVERIGSMRGSQQGLISPSLCHGYSGIITIANRLSISHPSDNLKYIKKYSIAKMIEMANQEDRFIFSNHKTPDIREDDPGFLTGAAGVLLTLTANTGQSHLKWQSLLLN